MSNGSSITQFLLLEFTDTQELQLLTFWLFLGIYLAALLGNSLIITAIACDYHLHTPMYFFLLNLSLIDLGCISTTLPKAMANSPWDTRTISYSGCVAQLFFFLFLITAEFSLLTLMAYDRSVAICQPLHYGTLLGSRACAHMAAAAWGSCFLNSLLHSVNTFSLPLCQGNALDQFFCEIPQLLKLSCSDSYLREVGLIVVSASLAFGCFVFIVVSYVQIFRAVLRIPSEQGQHKAFSTCLPHLAVVSLFLITGIFAHLKPLSTSSPSLDLVVSFLYSVVPPAVNPLIYSLRNQELKDALKKLIQSVVSQQQEAAHFRVLCKPDESALHQLLQAFGKEVNQDRSQDEHLQYCTCYWSGGREPLLHHDPLNPTIKPVIQTVMSLLGYKNRQEYKLPFHGISSYQSPEQDNVCFLEIPKLSSASLLPYCPRELGPNDLTQHKVPLRKSLGEVSLRSSQPGDISGMVCLHVISADAQWDQMSNSSSITQFLLLAFADRRELQLLTFWLFLGIYLAALLGNGLIITTIACDHHLHTPMYFFLLNLSLFDMGFISATVPKAMASSLWDNRAISYAGCATQLFLFLFFVSAEMYLLTVMSYDRYVAICRPLHYGTLLGSRACVHMAAAAWGSGFLNAVLHTANTFSIPLCQGNALDQFFCEIPQILKLSCSDSYLREVGLIKITAFLAFGCFVFIVVSYVQIFRAVLRIPSEQGRHKAFSTCLPHLAVVSLYVSTATFAYLKPPSISSPVLNLVVPFLYSVVPPTMNPLIYSLRNNELKDSLKKLMTGCFQAAINCPSSANLVALIMSLIIG
ncbi:uncharacterized protein FYN12_014517 [Phoenicopterus ruber ruber]